MKIYLASSLTIAGLLFATLPTFAQIPLKTGEYRAFNGEGQPASLAQIVERAGNADVVFLGEEHNDAVGHSLQAELFKQIVAKYKASRKVALSMEMFERDTQVVVDEYLKDLITEKQFLSNARPWNNYAQDYKPLVEEAKSNGLPVIAANTPRRYVNMVTRKGRAALNALSPQAKTWLPPLPYGKASAAYQQKLAVLFGGGPTHGAPAPASGTGLHNMHAAGIGDSQSLWDAGMAWSIAGFLKKTRSPLVVQLNGKFHSESRLGTVEHLLAYRPKTKVLVVTVLSDRSFPEFDSRTQQGLGDFVILTDPEVERSFKGQ